MHRNIVNILVTDRALTPDISSELLCFFQIIRFFSYIPKQNFLYLSFYIIIIFILIIFFKDNNLILCHLQNNIILNYNLNLALLKLHIDTKKPINFLLFRKNSYNPMYITYNVYNLQCFIT